MHRSRWISVAATAALLLMPLLAAAQEGPMPMTWAGLLKVKPGAGMLFEKAFEKYDLPVLNQLITDGKASSWALGYELAGPGGFDYVFWINAPGWAAVGDVEGAFEARYEGMSEDEVAQMIEDWTAAIEPGTDKTLLLSHAVFKANPDADWKYLRLSYYTATPGHGADLMKMYTSYWVPIFDQLLESGVIAGYGMAEQAVHSDTAFTHEAWIAFSSLADLDNVEKAIDKASGEVSEGEDFARGLAFMKIVEPGTHFDRLIRVWKRSE